MVTFTEITSKSVRATYEKTDIEGYKIFGSVSYDKESKITDADGEIREVATQKLLTNFNTYGTGDDARINLTNCLAGKMSEAVAIAEATLADLAATYPEE